jgi:hypothetical protein
MRQPGRPAGPAGVQALKTGSKEGTMADRFILMDNARGADCAALRTALVRALGPAATGYADLATGDDFSTVVKGALARWQAEAGLVADGICGPCCQHELGLRALPDLEQPLEVRAVSRLFPATRPSGIVRHLPYLAAALAAFNLVDRPLILLALAVIRAECEGFVPIGEAPSHGNTLPGLAPFSAYEGRFGNRDTGDGARYRGRGFVRLTGRGRYHRAGALLGIDLEVLPELANAPEVAACLLAARISERADDFRSALARGDLRRARRMVNGATHGFDRFRDVFHRAGTFGPLPAVPQAVASAHRSADSGFAAVRAELDAIGDAVDLRDRPYQPPVASLPPQFPADPDIHHLFAAYARAGLILDQGLEGACTGFGLACVINYLRWRMLGMPAQLPPVSARMLYDLARRYDEYEGEDYEGSSCRGALKGWSRHGVCLEEDWPYRPGGAVRPRPGWVERAIEQTLGVYYRIDTTALCDLQAAILQIGAVYASAWTHAGWDLAGAAGTPLTGHACLPVIPYHGQRSRSGGHAFALVGFNRDGFVVQNSWGRSWGADGFAVLSYADWLAHAMDAWTTALGVAGVVDGRMTARGTTAALAVARDQAHWWSEEQAYTHSIVLGNNGRVSRYLHQDAVSRTLRHQAGVLPDSWFRATATERKRLILYAHGGLNSEADAIARARVMGRYCTGNGCYPLFVAWKTGPLETIANIIAERIGLASRGAATRTPGELISAATDRMIETAIGRPFARPLWSEMKENAALAVQPGRGGDLLTDGLRHLADLWGDRFELHLVGHSAGAILLGHLVQLLARQNLARLGPPVRPGLHGGLCQPLLGPARPPDGAAVPGPAHRRDRAAGSCPRSLPQVPALPDRQCIGSGPGDPHPRPGQGVPCRRPGVGRLPGHGRGPGQLAPSGGTGRSRPAPHPARPPHHHHPPHPGKECPGQSRRL